MDNMLQLDMLSEDTRSLFVPTSLEKLTINTKQHVAIVQALAAESEEVGEYSQSVKIHFQAKQETNTKHIASSLFASCSFPAWLSL